MLTGLLWHCTLCSSQNTNGLITATYASCKGYVLSLQNMICGNEKVYLSLQIMIFDDDRVCSISANYDM